MSDREYTYLVSYVGRLNGNVVNGHIEIALLKKWSRGDTMAVCESLQEQDDVPNQISILSAFQL